MSLYLVLSLLLVGSAGFAFETTSIEQTSHSTQQSIPASGNAHILDIQFSRRQIDESSIIEEEANRIFDTIGLANNNSDNYQITPDMAYFNFFADNFSFFRSHSTQWDDGIYDYRLPTSGYLHLKTFRFLVDTTNQKLKMVVARSTFL
ncbi:hypothetical protein ELI02_10360 [Rhizobium leguminosarum]|uniref:hypothetical protein n=1 Tax=Rhizobium leguminosarum TaxID=384 RepID=UPI001030E54C|nr:hypothetical protein [Rhizobium leguminosarum]TAX60382.1 hypothetical protein ELI02_10360 [Rhizobium leguminosarum]